MQKQARGWRFPSLTGGKKPVARKEVLMVKWLPVSPPSGDGEEEEKGDTEDSVE